MTHLSLRLQLSIDWSFGTRYCMDFYLNWHRNYKRSNMELSNFLIEDMHLTLTFRDSCVSEIKVHAVSHFKISIPARFKYQRLRVSWHIYCLPSHIILHKVSVDFDCLMQTTLVCLVLQYVDSMNYWNHKVT